MKINKYHPMGDIYLFKMLILLIKMHIYVLNQKSKEFSLVFLVDTFFMSAGTMTLPQCSLMLCCQQGGMPSSASAKTNFLIYHPKSDKIIVQALTLLIKTHIMNFNRKTKEFLDISSKIMYHSA